MRSTPTITHPHRAQRLLRWAALWLVWLASFVYDALRLDPRRPPLWVRRHLQFAVRVVGMILIVNAASRMSAPARTRHRYGRLKLRGRTRALIGAQLRHALRAGSVRDTLAALHAAIAQPERHTARLIHRLRHGLTRLRTIAPTRCAEAHTTQTALAPACANTS